MTNPAPQAVYQSMRVGTFSYALHGLTSGKSYTVRLHFAEYAHTAAGQRTFNVSINGTQVLTNFDIFATAGGEFKANVQQFNAVAEVGIDRVHIGGQGCGRKERRARIGAIQRRDACPG